jgi:hypothetical protein
VLGLANGLDDGSAADAAVDALRVAALAGAVETMASAVVAKRMLRIISLPELR